MANDGWLEQRTRIPFVGIIAIVLIVAFTAAFFKVPTNDFEISSTQDALRGKASSSFQGERTVPLSYEERLQGLYSSSSGTTLYSVDVSSKVLYIKKTNTEEVLLEVIQDGKGLTATFELQGIDTRVDIYPADEILYHTNLATGAVTEIKLTETIGYEGIFVYNEEDYTFMFNPSGNYAQISAKNSYRVPLTETGHLYTGTWREYGNAHPVTVDTLRLVAVIEEVW